MFAETQDQQVFASTTKRFLDAHYPISKVRELATEETAFDPQLWREAAALGWTALLVSEDAGGGSISDNGLADLLIVAAEFGHHAAPGPLLGTNAVAAALGRWGSSEQQHGPLAEIVAGDAVGAWAYAPEVTARVSGDAVVVDGDIANVESAGDATYLLVSADELGGRSHYLISLASPGVELTRLQSIDLTRHFYQVSLRGVEVSVDARVGERRAADEQDALLLDIVSVIALGEMVGAVARSFEMTLEWTLNRYSFGRPLGSYQAIKHRMADVRTQLEASEAVADRAAFAVGTGAPDARAWAHAGMAYVGRYGPEIIQECIQFHGGIGVTYDHDLHVFLRRVTLDANVFGSPGSFAYRLGDLVATMEGAL